MQKFLQEISFKKLISSAYKNFCCRSNRILHPSPSRKFKFIQSLFSVPFSTFSLSPKCVCVQYCSRLCKLIFWLSSASNWMSLAIYMQNLSARMHWDALDGERQDGKKAHFCEIIKRLVKIEISDLDFIIYATFEHFVSRLASRLFFTPHICARNSIKTHLSTFRNYSARFQSSIASSPAFCFNWVQFESTHKSGSRGADLIHTQIWLWGY